MINRQEALEFLEKRVESKNILKHMLACEELMGEIYESLKQKNEKDLGGTKEEWMMAGLLHDGDYCLDVPPEKQGVQITQWLREEGFDVPENVARAMASHNHLTGTTPVTKMDWALFCGDSLTGLIVAATLVLPSRKIADLTVENVLNRFKEKSFARGTRREDIALCKEKLGLELKEFIEIGLRAMQKISSVLGL
jgi:predicted hydrolase (HD superfamily)